MLFYYSKALLKADFKESSHSDIQGVISTTQKNTAEFAFPQECVIQSGVLTNDYKYKELCAFLEVKNYDDFEELVKNRGENWDDNVNLWSGFSWEDYGKEMLDCCGYNIPEHLLDFFDLERYPHLN